MKTTIRWVNFKKFTKMDLREVYLNANKLTLCIQRVFKNFVEILWKKYVLISFFLQWNKYLLLYFAWLFQSIWILEERFKVNCLIFPTKKIRNISQSYVQCMQNRWRFTADINATENRKSMEINASSKKKKWMS